MDRKIYITDSNIHLFLLSVYREDIENKFTFIFGDDNIKTKDNDIIIFTEHTSPFFMEDCGNKNTLKIFFDITGEYNHLSSDKIYSWLSNKNNFFISERFSSLKHKNALTGLRYLSLVYHFAKFNFFQKSKITFPKIDNVDFDFVAFLGKEIRKRIERNEILNFIFDNDLSNCKVDHGDFNDLDFLQKNNYHFDVYDFSWNLLQGYSGKINLIFETTNLFNKSNRDKFLYDEFYLTEKTLRCLMSPTPSIIFVYPEIIQYLNSLGFKFPYKGFNNYDELKNYIQYINQHGIDEWIKNNNDCFLNNSLKIWEVMNKKETFIKDILI